MKIAVAFACLAALPAVALAGNEGNLAEEAASESDCVDLIEQVQAGREQPLFQRRLADADEPLLYSAVDRRIEGCSVLRMHATGDVRPVPQPKDTPVRLIPAQ